MGNLGSCCRLCLLSMDDQRVNVEKDEIFQKQFTKIFQYEIFTTSEPGTYPKSVCQECYTKVTNFYTYFDNILTCKDRFKEFADKDKDTIKNTLNDHQKTSLKRKLESDIDEEGRKKIKVGENSDDILKREFKLACDRCSANYETFEALCDHYKKAHNVAGFVVCCNERFTTKELAVDHAEWHSNQNLFKCFYCPSRYSKRVSLRNHELACEKMDHRRSFRCKECPKSFFSKKECGEHENAHELSPKCKYCRASFRTLDLLEQHMVDHPGKRLYHCTICQYTTNYKYRMDEHDDAKHNTNMTETYINFSDLQVAEHLNMDCSICPDKISFPYHDDLMQHFREVHDEIAFIKCCDYKFYTKANMMDHVEYHLQPDKFKCRGCGKHLLFGSDLRRHEVTCDKIENKKQCAKCHTTFMENDKFEDHVKNAHVKEQLKCTKCDYTISKTSKLKEHMITVHEGKKLRFACKLCEFSTTNYKNFLHHLERSHQSSEQMNSNNGNEEMD